MGISVDDIVAKFPNKTLPVIQGETDYETINNMVQLLQDNAASPPTPLGGGQHGHIGLLMTPALYTTLSATAYVPPLNPGIQPTWPAGSSQANRDLATTQYKSAHFIYDQHGNMDTALKTQILDCIDDTYLNELRNKYTGYLGVTTRDVLDHLLDRYGKISPAGLALNDKTFNTEVDTTQPIDVYFRRIEDYVTYSADGGVAISPAQTLNTAYHNISKTGQYNEACKEWHKQAANLKTWANFKQFFAAEYHDLKEQQKIYANQANFHSANATIDIAGALDNLAMAAMNDKDIVTQLTQTNATLTQSVKDLVEQLKVANAMNTTLLAKIGSNTLTVPPRPPTTGGGQPRPRKTRAEWLATLDPDGYCWTHGYRVTKGHNSEDCTGKLGGHQDKATRTNNLGGSQKGK